MAPKRSRSTKNDGIKKAVRVPRACDNCRLRKSKCDGQFPCSFCQLHDSECTYDNTRPKKQLDTKYIVSLERTIDRLKELLNIPVEVEVTEESLESFASTSPFQANAAATFQATSKQDVGIQTSPPPSIGSPVPRTLLESMVEATGRLNIDEDGSYDYSGNSSGLLLVERIRERCDYLLERKHGPGPRSTPWQRSSSGSLIRAHSQPRLNATLTSALPLWDVMIRHLNVAFADAFSLYNFIHRPSFESRLQMFYASRNAGLSLTYEDVRFEALLNSVCALGCLFNGSEFSVREAHGRELDKAEEHFRVAQRCLDLTECRDVTSLQALLCLVIYLQGSAQLPSCYTYISLAMTAAIRMGLHRADSLSDFNPIDSETRKRIFWSLRTMDSYITTVLDLPSTLNDTDTDQAYPLEVDDSVLTHQKMKSASRNEICPMSSVNAHTRLARILTKVKSITSGSSTGEQKPNHRYQIDYAKVVEAEHDLAEWTTTLPEYSKLPDPVPRQVEKAQLLLRIAHGHVQMVLYRPFLHHIARRNSDPNFDYRAFACASQCIKAAMQVIWLVGAMDEAELLHGPSWLLFFTLFMAVVSSIMFVITNKDDSTTQEYYSAAKRGFKILERFADNNQMARTYSESLRPLFSRNTAFQSGSDVDSEMIIPPSLMGAEAGFPPSFDASSKSAVLNRKHPSPSMILQSNASGDYYPAESSHAVEGANMRPSWIPLPPSNLPSMDDPAERQIYLQAMNYTPSNFFEGFSSETAMMDYFGWHENDAGPSNEGGFPFQ